MIDNFKRENNCSNILSRVITPYSYNTLTQSDAASELVIVELYNLVALNSFPSFGRASAGVVLMLSFAKYSFL